MTIKCAPVLFRSVSPVLLAAILVLAIPGEADACSCAPVTTAEMVASAELVFVGEEVLRVEARQEWPPVAITFSVVEAYKGDLSSEMTVWTGQGDGDCGLGPTRGVVGITAYTDGNGVVSVDSCGSLHDVGAIAALLDPVEIIDAAPDAPAPGGGGSGVPWPVLVLAGAAGIAALAVVFARRQRDDWQDGWSSGA